GGTGDAGAAELLVRQVFTPAHSGQFPGGDLRDAVRRVVRRRFFLAVRATNARSLGTSSLHRSALRIRNAPKGSWKRLGDRDRCGGDAAVDLVFWGVSTESLSPLTCMPKR